MAKNTENTAEETATRHRRNIATEGLDLPKTLAQVGALAKNLAVICVLRKSPKYEVAAQAAQALAVALQKSDSGRIRPLTKALGSYSELSAFCLF
jgi:hypothetical protein